MHEFLLQLKLIPSKKYLFLLSNKKNISKLLSVFRNLTYLNNEF